MVSFVDAFDLRLNECGIVDRKHKPSTKQYCPVDQINQSVNQSIKQSNNQATKSPPNHVHYVYDEERASSVLPVSVTPSNKQSDIFTFCPDAKEIRTRLMNDKRYTVKSVTHPNNPSSPIQHYEEEKELIDETNNPSTNQPFHLLEERKSTYFTPSAPFVRGLKPPPFIPAFNQAISQTKQKLSDQKKQLINESNDRSNRDRIWLLSQIHHVNLGSCAMNSLNGLMDFQSINQLKIDHNCLVFIDLIPASVNQLIASHNRIRSIDQSLFTDRLTELDLSYNQLEILPSLTQSIVPSLSKLNLSFNSFCNLEQSIEQLKQFPKLVDLHFIGNPCSIHPYYRSVLVDSLPDCRMIDGLSTAMSDEEQQWRQSLIEKPVAEPVQEITPPANQSAIQTKGGKVKPAKSPVANPKKKAAEQAALEAEQAIKAAQEKEAQRLLDLKIAEWTFRPDQLIKQSVNAQLVVQCTEFTGFPQPVQSDPVPAVKPDKSTKKSPANADQSSSQTINQLPVDEATAVEFDFQHEETDENGSKIYVKTSISKHLTYQLRCQWIDRTIESTSQSWNASMNFALTINECLIPSVKTRDFLVTPKGMLIELVQKTHTEVKAQRSNQPISQSTSQPVKGAKKGAAPVVDTASITQEQSSSDLDTVIASTSVPLAYLFEPQLGNKNMRSSKMTNKWIVNQATSQQATMLLNQTIQSTATTPEEHAEVISSIQSMTTNPILPDLSDLENTAALEIAAYFNDDIAQIVDQPVEQPTVEVIKTLSPDAAKVATPQKSSRKLG